MFPFPLSSCACLVLKSCSFDMLARAVEMMRRKVERSISFMLVFAKNWDLRLFGKSLIVMFDELKGVGKVIYIYKKIVE